MKKAFNILILVLLLGIAGTNAFLFKKLEQTEKAISKIEHLRVAIPDDLKNKIENEAKKNLKQAGDATVQTSNNVFFKVEKELLRSLGRTEENSKSSYKELSDNAKNIEKELINSFKQAADNSKQKIDNISADIERLVRQKILHDENAAKQAHEEALRLLKAGKPSAAKIYCLNAINHTPGKKQYFESLISILEKSPRTTPADWEQAKNVLEIGIYQVHSQDVDTMLKLLTTVNKKISQQTELIARNKMEQEQKQVAQALAELRSGKLSWDVLNEKKIGPNILRNRLEKLNILASDYELSQEDMEFCQKEITATTAMLEFLLHYFNIDASLKRAEEQLNAAEQNPDKLPEISALVQMANNKISESWNIINLPLPQHQSLLNEQIKRIANLENKFNKIKSRPACEKIRKEFELLERYPNTFSYTQKIQLTQDTLRKVAELMPGVFDPELRQEIQKQLNKKNNLIKEYTLQRYQAYQTWAVKQCESAAIEEIATNEEWATTAEEAKTNFQKNLIKIDPALLAPEVHRAYQRISNRLLTILLKKKEFVTFEAEIALTPKETLEKY